MLARGREIRSRCIHIYLITSICMISGCVAYKFSSDYLPFQENDQSKVLFQTVVVGVEITNRAQLYELETFVAALKKTGLFKKVEYMDRLSEADLVLTAFSQTGTDPYEACPLGLAGQVLAVGTAGIIPQVCKSEHQVSFVLYGPKKEEERKKSLSVKYETMSIVGWAALFYTASAGWTMQPSEERYPNWLKAVFYREANDIRRLLQ